MYSQKYRGKSFGAILDLNHGAGLGFDLLRLGLAITILWSHSSGISGHSGVTTSILNSILNFFSFGAASAATVSPAAVDAVAQNGDPTMTGLHGLGRPFTLSHVPMFFALSGFLVAGSAVRTRNLVKFLGLRVLRILPALFVEVLLSAVILGAVFTTLPLNQYFSSAGFWRYFYNIIGYIHYFLPGVFEVNPGGPVVNANLWTLPFEFECYLLMSVLMLAGLIYKPKLLSILFIISTVGLLIANSFFGYQITQVQLEGRVMIYYFATGLLFFLWKDKIIFHEGIFLVCGALSYWLMMYTTTVYLYPILLTYVTIFIGLIPFPQFRLLKSGDYSYGVYLYGYPVTRGLVELFPAIRSNLPVVAISATVLTCLFAAFSWHAVEKHCLKLKKYLSPKSASITASLHPETADKGSAIAEIGDESASKPVAL